MHRTKEAHMDAGVARGEQGMTRGEPTRGKAKGREEGRKIVTNDHDGLMEPHK